MISPAKALSVILSHCPLQPAEHVALDKALGRVLARPVRADRDLPPADRSAMDGYAIRADDLSSVPCELKLVGEVAAGSKARPTVRPGTCVRILTGANIPPEADSVAIVESTSEIQPDRVCFRSKVLRGANIFRRGENARKGQVLLSKGTRFGPSQIAVCATVGADPVDVFVQPQVGVLCTGRELVETSARAPRYAERDSNGPALRAALQTTGLAECKVSGVVDDDQRVLRQEVRRALKACDVLLLVGGVSVGKYDFVPRALKDLGCREAFHGVAMKPGKPTLFALGPDKQLVFGLPGNPLSAMTSFFEFVVPALRKMSGLAGPPQAKIRVRLRGPLNVKPSTRTRFLPARLHSDPAWGAPVAVPVATHSSADVVAGGHSDGVLVLPPLENDYKAGTLLEFRPWDTVS